MGVDANVQSVGRRIERESLGGLSEGAKWLADNRPTPAQAEVILLRVVAGLDTDAVARIVGRSPGAVRVAAHRGLRKLAENLAEAGVTL